MEHYQKYKVASVMSESPQTYASIDLQQLGVFAVFLSQILSGKLHLLVIYNRYLER